MDMNGTLSLHSKVRLMTNRFVDVDAPRESVGLIIGIREDADGRSWYEVEVKDDHGFAVAVIGARGDELEPIASVPPAALNGSPCEQAIEKALQAARKILIGELDPFDGGRQIAWLGSADCYDFLNEVEVVDAMAGFWQLVDYAEIDRAIGLPAEDKSAEVSEEIRRAASALINAFGRGRFQQG